MTKEILHTDQAPAAVGPYSQAVAVPAGGKVVYLSGQIGLDPATGVMVNDSFDDYVDAFPSKCRRKSIRRECRRIANSGVTFRYVDDFTDLAEDFCRLHRATDTKYNSSNLHLDPEFWTPKPPPAPAAKKK